MVRVADRQGAGDMVIGVTMRLMMGRWGNMLRVVTQHTGENHGHNLQGESKDFICLIYLKVFIDLQLRVWSAT